MKERAGDLELINPCGRIPLIFQCSLGSGELPKWGLKISLCNREVQISHLPRAQVTPRTEAALLLWAKTPWILLFLVTESGGGKGKNRLFQFGIGFVWGTLRTQSPSTAQSQQQWGDICRSHWALHPLPAPRGCLSFVPIWICCSVGSAPSVGDCWRQFQEQIREYWGDTVILTHPWVIYCTCSHLEPRTDVLDPTSTFLCSHCKETTQPSIPKQIPRN